MIINHGYRFIFIHVPKSAGTSVTQALSALNSWRDQEIGGSSLGEAVQPFMRDRFGLSKHSRAAEVCTIVGHELWARYFSFAFVREPVARVHSIWSFLNKWTGYARAAEVSAMRSLDEFVQSPLFADGGPDRICRPQAHWIDAPLGMVGRVETLQDDMQRILKTVEVPARLWPEMPHTNVSGAREGVLSAASMAVLERMWQADFEMYEGKH